GITAAAIGLLIAVVAKMAAPLFRKGWDWGPPVAVAAFIGVAIMQWPLPLVFVTLAPISIALAWVKRWTAVRCSPYSHTLRCCRCLRLAAPMLRFPKCIGLQSRSCIG